MIFVLKTILSTTISYNYFKFTFYELEELFTFNPHFLFPCMALYRINNSKTTSKAMSSIGKSSVYNVENYTIWKM